MKKAAMKENLTKIINYIDKLSEIQEYLLNNEVWLHSNKPLEMKKFNLLINTYKLHIQFLLAKILKEELKYYQ